MLLDSLTSPSRYGDPDIMGYDEPLEDTQATNHTNTATAMSNDLDDIFGSAPPSPTNAITGRVSHQNTPSLEPSSRDPTNSDPILSDIPRLRTQHVTAGYRDGIAAAKAGSVQVGFDEGYALGAEVGMAAGWIKGVLSRMVKASSRTAVVAEHGRAVREAKTGSSAIGARSERTMPSGGEGRANARVGIEVLEDCGESSPGDRLTGGSLAMNATGSTQDEALESAQAALSLILKLAEADLAAHSLFSPLYFDADGVWKYDLTCATANASKHAAAVTTMAEGEPSHDDADIAFREVALAHPLIVKWNGVIEPLAKKFGLNLHKVAA